MEFLIQFVDELEDICYAAPLLWERLRRVMLRITVIVACVLTSVAGVALALTHPPLAVAVVFLFSVGLLFRAVLLPVAKPSPGH